MRIFFVSAFLPDVTQQIHSLRASGVISSHTANALGEEVITSRKSDGTLCTVAVKISPCPLLIVLDYITRTMKNQARFTTTKRLDLQVEAFILIFLSLKREMPDGNVARQFWERLQPSIAMDSLMRCDTHCDGAEEDPCIAGHIDGGDRERPPISSTPRSSFSNPLFSVRR